MPEGISLRAVPDPQPMQTDWQAAYQGFLAVSTEPLLLVSCTDHRIQDANPAAGRLYGQGRSQLIGRDFGELFSERRHMADIFDLHRDFIPLRFQRTADDRHVPVEISLHYFETEGREMAAVSVRDISGRLSRQREENETERKYQSLFEASPYPILMLNAQGVIADANRSSLVCYGFERHELTGRDWSVLEVEPCPHSFLIRPSLLPPREHRRKDGSLFIAEVTLSYFRLREQSMVLALVRDVTEHWRTFRQLQESEARWRFAIEGQGDALIDWPVGGDGRPFLSPSLSRMLGQDAESDGKLAMDDWRARIHPDDLRLLALAVQRHTENPEEVVQAEGRLQTRDGSYRWVALRAKLIVTADGNRRLIGAVRDIHDARLRQQQRAADREKMFRLERLATAGEMLSALAHEINQPLAAIANYSAAAAHQLSGKGTRADAKTSVSKINVQAMRAGEIVRRIRDFVRRGEPAYAPADLNALIRRVAGWAERQALAAGIHIDLELDPNLPDTQLDILQIEQVVFNLMKNGLEAMQDEALSQPRRLLVSSIGEGDAVEVAVRDYGEGLADTESGTIFEPFVSTKPDGMGMGLAICRTIIENHRGSLWFETFPEERGTRFAFVLNLRGTGQPELSENVHD